MPYYPEDQSDKNLKKIRLNNLCAECGGSLYVYLDMKTKQKYIGCSIPDHKGITRKYQPQREDYESGVRRLYEMEQEHGAVKTKALGQYVGTSAITKSIATEIVETLWGEAPLIEKTKAILLCQTYQLNPLMKHIHMVGYKRRDRDGKYIKGSDGKDVLDWSMMIGIGANRLMAQRKHNYSYLDLTPRQATKEEIDKILGDTADPGSIYGFVHIKDVETGAEAFGLRGIKKNDKIKGEEKGNTHLNMACVRAERLALDRQYPGEMPQDAEVIDEAYVEVPNVGKVVEATGEIVESEAVEVEEKKPVSKGKAKPAAKDQPPDELLPGSTEKDETPMTPEQLEDLHQLMKDNEMDLVAIGKYCNADKRWNIRNLNDLKKWQYDELVQAFDKGKA